MNIIESTREAIRLFRVKMNAENIADMKKPSEQLQMVAIKNNPGTITLLDNPCEAAQIYVAERDPFSVSLYPSSETARMVAIEKDPTVIVHIKKPSVNLCKAAIEKAFPNAEIDFHLTPQNTNDLFKKIKNIETVEKRMKVFEEFKSDIVTERNIRIEAIQILEGNSPEKIFDTRFFSVSNQFPFEAMQLNESINDVESSIKCSEPRMLSDNHFRKVDIRRSAQYFADQIKSSLTPEELLSFSQQIKSPSNFPLGKTPTIEETLSLFKNVYIQKENISAVFENEVAGRYEVHNPTIQLEFRGEELLRAGTHPYSPNYKEVFIKMGLKQEFEKFEVACCERTQWNYSYNYAVEARDIADIYNLEGKLPDLNEKVESSRNLVYNKLNDLCSIKEANSRNQIEIYSSSSKTLISEAKNYRITDKSTGKTEPLNVGDIDLNKQSPETIKELLSGKQVKMTAKSGTSQMVGLSKTPGGWGLQIGRQAFSATDSGAEI